MVIPNVPLTVFQIPLTSEVWIRIVGMLMIYLGIYYIVASRAELRPIIVWSVWLRASVILVLSSFVLAGLAPIILILFAAVDLGGALWTWSALRKQTSGRQAYAVKQSNQSLQGISE